MGQYFGWVNVDRFERLDAGLWDYAPTLYGRCVAPCEENLAMLSLLATRWRGDVVVFLGDYASFEGDERPGCRHVRERIGTSGRSVPDFASEAKDVTGCLRVARDSPRNRRNSPSDESLDLYEGPFDLEVREWRYAVNPARHEYVDYLRMPILSEPGHPVQRLDPLPLLLASEVWAPGDPGDKIEGRWLGDVVYPTDDAPGGGFVLVGDTCTGPVARLFGRHCGLDESRTREDRASVFEKERH